jgi:predicted acylesterase/phospholipase RssA
MPEHTRIAVVISGGVSLGTYEAGALTKLLTATALGKDPEHTFECDVFVGASAGAMTAALAAHPSAPPDLSLAFPLTNLNGVTYRNNLQLARPDTAGVAPPSPYPFQVTFLADSAVFKVPQGLFDGLL